MPERELDSGFSLALQVLTGGPNCEQEGGCDITAVTLSGGGGWGRVSLGKNLQPDLLSLHFLLEEPLLPHPAKLKRRVAISLLRPSSWPLTPSSLPMAAFL